MLGKELKELVTTRIADDDIVCLGEQGDKMGRYDNQILGVEIRQVGFDNNNTYKAIVGTKFNSNGAMKFWR